jgi:hypothetical protein
MTLRQASQKVDKNENWHELTNGAAYGWAHDWHDRALEMKMHTIRTQIKADIEKYQRLLAMAKRNPDAGSDISSDSVAIIERSITNLRRMLDGSSNQNCHE